MIEEDEARNKILERTPIGSAVRIPLDEACGAYLAKELLATVDLPGFDNSSMDGYAIRAADQQNFETLRVGGEQPAGPVLPLPVAEGEAIRIFTGAPIPDEADAVVMQEDTQVEEGADGERWLRITDPVEKGENIRACGGDLCVGQKILSAHDLLTSSRIGLLASQGLDWVDVIGSPRVAIVVTGDELVPVGRPLRKGQIYNSNGPMLQTLVRQAGAKVERVFHAKDDVETVEFFLSEALEHCDITIVTGGVSVGERDLVKDRLNALGVDTGFWRVKVKPGKPFLFGTRGEDRLVFGLPGNPVSSYVTFLLFVLPALLKWRGRVLDDEKATVPLQKFKARLLTEMSNPGDRPHYIRGRVNVERATFEPLGLQESHAVFGLSQANALLRLDPQVELKKHARRDVFLLDPAW